MECRGQPEQQLAGWNQPCLEEHLAEIATCITEWRDRDIAIPRSNRSRGARDTGSHSAPFCSITEDSNAETVEKEKRSCRHL